MIQQTETVTALTDWLRKGDEADRCYTARALGLLGDPTGVEPLIERLRDEDIDVSIDAALALGAIGDPRAVPALLESLDNDPNGEVCTAVVDALGKIGGDEAITALIRIAGNRPEHIEWSGEWDDWWDMQLKAVEVLGEREVNAATSVLRNILADEDGQDIEASTLKALARIGGDGLALLIERLKGGTPRDRRRAAQALREARSPSAVRALGRALQDSEAEVRAAAVESLAALNAREYAGAILLLLKDSEAEVRAASLKASSEWSEGDELEEALIDELSGLLQDPTATVRATVLEVLRRVLNARTFSPAMRERVIQLLDDADDLVAEEACRLLVARGDAETVPALLAVAQNGHRSGAVRREAVLALGALAESAEGIYSALLTAMLDTEQPVRFGALQAMMALDKRLGTTQSPLLQPVMDAVAIGIQVADPDSETEQASAAAEEEEKESTDPVAERLADHREPERFEDLPDQRAAQSTLASIAMDNVTVAMALHENSEQEKASEDLEEVREYQELIDRTRADREFLFPDRNTPVEVDLRRLAARLLGDSDRPEAVAALITAMNDEDKELRQAAMESLATMAERKPDIEGLMDAFGILITQLAMDDDTVRVLAIRALGNLRNRAALAPLLETLRSDQIHTRIATLNALAKLLLNSRDPQEADHMVIDDVDDETIARQLLNHLTDSAVGVRVTAAEALARDWRKVAELLESETVVDAMIDAAFLGAGEQARKMGRALRHIGDDGIQKKLLDKLNNLETSAERRFAIELLEELHATCAS